MKTKNSFTKLRRWQNSDVDRVATNTAMLEAHKNPTSSPSRTKLFPTVVLASSRSMASMYSFIPRKLPTSSDLVVRLGFTLSVVPADVDGFAMDDFTGLLATGGLACCGLELVVVVAAVLWGFVFGLIWPEVFAGCGFLCFRLRGEQNMSPSSSSDSYSSMSELDAPSSSSNSTSVTNVLIHRPINSCFTVTETA